MEFITIRNKDHIYFDKMWEIYDEAFPAEEKRTKEEHINAIANKGFFSDVILLDGNAVGIFFYWKLDKYVYIEHFAIAKEKRSGGIGSAVLNEFLNANPACVLEIEPPADVITEKRRVFYERSGFKFYDHMYMHPSFGKRYPPYRLCLMSRGIDIRKEDAEELESFLSKIC